MKSSAKRLLGPLAMVKQTARRLLGLRAMMKQTARRLLGPRAMVKRTTRRLLGARAMMKRTARRLLGHRAMVKRTTRRLLGARLMVKRTVHRAVVMRTAGEDRAGAERKIPSQKRGPREASARDRHCSPVSSLITFPAYAMGPNTHRTRAGDRPPVDPK